MILPAGKTAQMAATALAALVLGACSTPASMQVRTGTDPANVDEFVRFRTTHYLRIVDQCVTADGTTLTAAPRVDSLYRFRMTGKAPALYTEIKFESGTLRASEVEPFGKSLSETQASYAALTDANAGCSGSAKAARGFQLWGPEGWRELNPDERLVMAMSTSARPLIGSLQRVARMQKSHNDPSVGLLMLEGQVIGANAAVAALEAEGEPGEDADWAQQLVEKVRAAYQGEQQ
ncbi:MAG: hypothetical protein ACPGUC_01555 [Gammaproteobacteria bacterium]